MFEVTLTKIESNHQRLRDDVITGLAPELPVAGSQFFMYRDSEYKEGYTRYIRTSTVQKVMPREDELIVQTENSLYSLKYKKAEVKNV